MMVHAPLQLDARQRDILAFMRLPMLGWPVHTPTPVARQPLSAEKISIETPDSGLNAAPAALKNIATPTTLPTKPARPSSQITPPTAATSHALQLWALDGTESTATPALAGKLLLLIEGQPEQNALPISADAQALLHNILAALQCPPDRLALCALPLAQPQADAYVAQIAAWQPAAALVLGRNASAAVLGTALQSGGLSALRGQVFDIAGIYASVSYPLDYLLRKPEAKASAWQDWLAAKWQWDALVDAQA